MILAKRTARLPTLVAACALGGSLLTIATQAAASGSNPAVRPGGMFRISLQGLDYVDPALAYSDSWFLLDTTCARLMTYPDKPPPEGYRLVPEVATRYPRRSSDGTTWTFMLRRGFRFSDGKPVRASAFAQAIARTLARGVGSPGAQYTREIVGAEDVLAGRRASPVGVVAHGNQLVVRFRRPVPDFPAQTSMPFFCAVPPALPPDPEGVGRFHGAGPYYVAEYRPGQRVVIKRNRFYEGKRPHHVDGFLVDLTANSDGEVVDRIESGQADWGLARPSAYFDEARRLVRRYGVKGPRFWVKPGLSVTSFVLNTSRGIFRNNPRLRRAVNFAYDRQAFVLASGSPHHARATDQLLPPGVPGFRDARIYPRRPDLRKARTLARGNLRGRKAVLYMRDIAVVLDRAQMVRRQLEKIGLDVEVRGIPPGAYPAALARPDEPWDIAFWGWSSDYIDPYSYINLQLDARFIGTSNGPRFSSTRYNGLMRRAARLQGAARYRAYSRLDEQLTRHAAPFVMSHVSNALTLVSRRVGCVVLRPHLDLTTVCLKR